MGKKIKKINELFLDEFELEIDNTELTEEEKKEEIEYINKMTEENLKDFPKAKSPQFTIEEFREIMLDLQRIDNFEYTQEEKDELDRDCMEMYGEPFFKKENDE